jgi:hypothetical protein
LGVRCSICGHPARAEIDAALIAGASTPGVARQFGVHRSSVVRHAKQHLAVEITEAARCQEEASAVAILAKAAELYERCEGLLGEADATLRQHPDSTAGITAATNVIRETRATLTLIAKALNAARRPVPEAPPSEHSDLYLVLQSMQAQKAGGTRRADGTIEPLPPCPQCGDQPEPAEWLKDASDRDAPFDPTRWEGLR